MLDYIEQFGWGVRHVMNGVDDPTDELPFSYTVGLTGLSHPEIVETGLPRESAQAFLNLVGDRYPHRALRRRAWELRDNVSFYDGLYVALAEATGLPLLTADAKLAGANGPRCELVLA